MKKLLLPLALLGAACASGGSNQGIAPVPASAAQVADLQTSMTEMLERIDVLNARISRLEEMREAPLSSPVPAPAPSPPAARAGGVPPNPIAATAQRAVLGAQIADAYRNALVLFGKNQAADARAAFQEVFNADPAGELADNALFWIGETFYTTGDYRNAMSYYRRVSEEFGDQNKAPDALFKLALALEKTGDLALARTTLQQVIARYPYSTPAASAKGELNRIKY
ncbi:MAG TPA: tol-pal system protein YbgF [Thermoanaerobaculia bacterium]|nr:tol-pal system protein YbgF [Thermoanaerobaculia bacterium]